MTKRMSKEESDKFMEETTHQGVIKVQILGTGKTVPQILEADGHSLWDIVDFASRRGGLMVIRKGNPWHLIAYEKRPGEGWVLIVELARES